MKLKFIAITLAALFSASCAQAGAVSQSAGSILAADLCVPYGMIMDDGGNLLVANHEYDGPGNTYCSTVTSISPAGDKKVFSSGLTWAVDLEYDSNKNIYVSTINGGSTVYKLDPATGAKSVYNQGGTPWGIAFNSVGNLYVSYAWSNDYVGIVTPTGGFSKLTMPTEAKSHSLAGMASDSSGNVYVGDIGNGKIYKINSSNVVSTFATVGYGGSSLAFDSDNNLYFGTPKGISKVSQSGVVTELITGFSGTPNGVYVAKNGDIYVSESPTRQTSALNRIWKFQASLFGNSSTTTCDTLPSYNKGFCDGQSACKANPSSCGLAAVGGTSMSPTTASGHATYTPSSNLVHIPYLDVPTLFGGTPTVYEVDLTVMPNTDPLQLKLQNAKQVQ